MSLPRLEPDAHDKLNDLRARLRRLPLSLEWIEEHWPECRACDGYGEIVAIGQDLVTCERCGGTGLDCDVEIRRVE
jgi:hypothetical protein